jgi:hypothetical protein
MAGWIDDQGNAHFGPESADLYKALVRAEQAEIRAKQAEAAEKIAQELVFGLREENDRYRKALREFSDDCENHILDYLRDCLCRYSIDIATLTSDDK